MSVAGIASHLPFQSVNQAFFFQPRLDVVELGQAINSGDLTKAQQLYDALTALGQNTPVISRSRILGWNRIFLRWASPPSWRCRGSAAGVRNLTAGYSKN